MRGLIARASIAPRRPRRCPTVFALQSRRSATAKPLARSLACSVLAWPRQPPSRPRIAGTTAAASSIEGGANSNACIGVRRRSGETQSLLRCLSRTGLYAGAAALFPTWACMPLRGRHVGPLSALSASRRRAGLAEFDLTMTQHLSSLAVRPVGPSRSTARFPVRSSGSPRPIQS